MAVGMLSKTLDARHKMSNRMRRYRENINNNIDHDYWGNWHKYKDLVADWKNYTGKILVVVAGYTATKLFDRISKLKRDNFRMIVIEQTMFKYHIFKPELCFNLDIFPWEQYGFMIGSSNTGLVCPSCVNGDNIKKWKGPKYIYRGISKGLGDIDEMYNKRQEVTGDVGSQDLISNVGMSILQFLQHIGASSRSYWVGLDFGFVDNHLYIDGMLKMLRAEALDRTVPREIQSGNFRTNQEYLGIGEQFVKYLRENGLTINWCSREGLFDFMPEDQYADVVKKCEVEEVANEN